MNCWAYPYSLRRGQLKLANSLQIDVLPGQPQIVGVLHGERTLGGTANSLGKAECHLRSDPAGALENAAESGGCNIQLFPPAQRPLMPLGSR